MSCLLVYLEETGVQRDSFTKYTHLVIGKAEISILIPDPVLPTTVFMTTPIVECIVEKYWNKN
jgi:hypothetical protein